jgi:sugar/nucleoside kinase (ribokinase family)
MYDVITIGGAALRDFTFLIDADKKSKSNDICLPAGTKINIDEAYFTRGGGACNVAVGLANFGLKVATVVRVGKDYSGRAIIDGLRNKKVDTQFVQIDKISHTGISAVIEPRGGDRTILTYRGANDNLEVKSEKLKKIKTKWLYLSTFSGNWQPMINQIFKLKDKNQDLKIAWNPSVIQLQAGKKKLEPFLKKTEILIVNRHEAAMLTGQSEKNISLLLKALYQLGPKIIVITCGSDGAYIMAGDEVLYEPSRSTKIIDTTGAGDSFSSGFLAILILFQDIKKALKLGILNSAANLRIIGAQEGLLTKKDLKKLKL